MARVLIISGSPTANSRLHGLTQYSEQRLQDFGHEVETLFVADLPAEDLIKANFAGPEIVKAVAAVDRADAVIIASPVYKASFTGVLKTFLDLLPQKGLQSKLVLPLFIGGSIAHLLAIDYALKPVVSALGGTHILQGVYGTDQWVTRLEEGGYRLDDDLQLRLSESVSQLHQELQWKTERK
ncbi:MAG: NADPH-dependent FMN reductase [Candidatus Cohnella colombiensis]|uniref:NADPH-dependent FMN reductase n=1 Tax=Candidatus Cohnella colombiensis TaxID=3121368 RepID=A0AA95F087_9BACL|nr:MAG: NADPH-dependent FMN reductase [Cohnella sp.]